MEDTIFAPHTGVDMQGHVGLVEYGGGLKGQMVVFYNRPVIDPQKSREAGRPQNVQKTYVKIQQPGERLNVIDREVTAQDIQNWPAQWNSFKANRQQIPEGTSIDHIFPDNVATPANLRAFGIYTIEQLAELSGDAIQNIGMGSQEWVNKAKRYLSDSNKGVKLVQYQHEMDTVRRENKVLIQQVEQLKKIVAELQANNNVGKSLAEIQQAIAGAMERPTHLQGAPGFDPATAMINANSPQTEIARKRRVESKPVIEKPVRRAAAPAPKAKRRVSLNI